MKPSLQYLILLITFATSTAGWQFGWSIHRPPCQPVHFDTLQAIKKPGNNLYFSIRGIHIGTKRGCYVTEVEAKGFKVNYPEAYSLWQYGMRMAPDEDEEDEVEEKNGMQSFPTLQTAKLTGNTDSAKSEGSELHVEL